VANSSSVLTQHRAAPTSEGSERGERAGTRVLFSAAGKREKLHVKQEIKLRQSSREAARKKEDVALEASSSSRRPFGDFLVVKDR